MLQLTADVCRRALTSVVGICALFLATCSASAQGGAGAHIYLFAVGMNGSNTGGFSLLSGTGVAFDSQNNGYLTADQNGFYQLSGHYENNCPSSDPLVYLLSVGGSVDGVNQNPYAVELAALPVTCSQLHTLPYVSINDATTVAAAFALAGFADVTDDGFSTTPKGVTALSYGFQYANKLVSSLDGTVAAGPAQSTINTLANLLNTCFMSSSGAACPQIFSQATVPGRLVPSDLWQATLNIAINPTHNVNQLFNLITKTPNQPSDTSAPSTWELGGSGIPTITSVTPDPSSNSQDNLIAINGDLAGIPYTTISMVVGGIAADFEQISQNVGYTVYMPVGATGAAVQGFAPGVASNPYAQPFINTTITTLLSPAQTTTGSTFIVSSVVAGDSGPPPAGTVTCSVSGQASRSAPLQQGSTSSSASLSFTAGVAGSYPVSCTYSGTPLFKTSSNIANGSIEQVTGSQASTTTTAVKLASGQVYQGSTAIATVIVSSQGSQSPDGGVSCAVAGTQQTFAGTLSHGQVTWPVAGLPLGSYSLACSYSGSAAFLASSSGSAQLQVITPPHPTWTQNGNATTPRAGHTATLLSDGTVLLAGGINNTPTCSVNNTNCVPFSAQNSAEIYNPQSHTFAVVGNSMQNGREGAASARLNGGQVLIAGGSYPTFRGTIPVFPSTLTADLFDPISRQFAPAGNMFSPRCGASATMLRDGHILIVGGSSSAQAELYDPATNTFAKTNGQQVVVRGIGATSTLLQDGRVLIVGGTDGVGCHWAANAVSSQDVLQSAEIYDPSTGTFSSIGNMNVARMQHTATLLSSGKVAIVGGTSDFQSGLNTIELFDPSSATFTYSGAQLSSGRAGHAASVLSNGLLLLSGGANPVGGTGGPHTTLATSELYDASTDTVTQTVSLNTGRDETTSVALADGSLLASGGSGGTASSPVLSSVETYSPQTVTGWVNPKYVVVGVTYAPPGASSTAAYSNSITQGTTTTLSDSFSSDYGLSVSTGIKIGGGVFVAGKVSYTASSATDYVQSTMTSNAVTLAKQTTFAETTHGVVDSNNPVDHRYDIVWIWLNPLALFTVDPNHSKSIVWDGYAYDPNDVPQQDIYPVLAGKLTGEIPMDPSTATVLARNWAKNQQWPSGEGPALTQDDYANIVRNDPFVQCSFNNATVTFNSCYFPQYNSSGGAFGPPLPTSTNDGRFTLLPTQTIPYTQGGPSVTYMESTTNTNVATSQTGHSEKQAFGLDVNFMTAANLAFFSSQLTVDTKYTQTLNWQHTFQQAITTSTINSSSITITPPSCSSGCSSYAGPGKFAVYQDNLFGTFLLYPFQ